MQPFEYVTLQRIQCAGLFSVSCYFCPMYICKWLCPVLNSPRHSSVKRDKIWDIGTCPVLNSPTDNEDTRGEYNTGANISLCTICIIPCSLTCVASIHTWTCYSIERTIINKIIELIVIQLSSLLHTRQTLKCNIHVRLVKWFIS